MSSPGRLAGNKTAGWRFHVTVCFGIVGGVLLIALTEVLAAKQLISGEVRDGGLIIGGALAGLVALCLSDLLRFQPEIRRMQRERQADRLRHQEERRLDFEQYRGVQAELRDMRSRVSTLQSKIDLTGALDRDRVGDALLVGFYFHRRSEALPSAQTQSIFRTAASRLKLINESLPEIKLDKAAVETVLVIAYGPVISEAFGLGYLLSHLGEDGFPETPSPQILAELEDQLKALKLDSKLPNGSAVSGDVAGLFKKLASRVVSIVRRV
ncbi:MAG: hypothetical protein JOZ77_10680 [Candidatus Eremiobacteraeota bacterium]|nr:hypothetical protein [Candidatus Eremiobacteraeota bacterium]